jgi:hypothetical protein
MATGNGRELVSASKMARHLGFERTNLDRLISQGVIERQGDGRFDLDATRLAYIKHLREERRRSPRSEADVEFQRAKAELIQIRIAERKKELMLASEYYETIDEIHGLFMTALSGLPAKIGGRDLARRREVERAIYDMRVELSAAATKLANERGEPPLSEQGPEARPEAMREAARRQGRLARRQPARRDRRRAGTDGRSSPPSS